MRTLPFVMSVSVRSTTLSAENIADDVGDMLEIAARNDTSVPTQAGNRAVKLMRCRAWTEHGYASVTADQHIVQMVAARTVGPNTGMRLFGKAGRIALRKVHRRPRARPGEAEVAVATHWALGILVDSGWETSSFREDVPRSQRSDWTAV